MLKRMEHLILEKYNSLENVRAIYKYDLSFENLLAEVRCCVKGKLYTTYTMWQTPQT